MRRFLFAHLDSIVGGVFGLIFWIKAYGLFWDRNEIVFYLC